MLWTPHYCGWYEWLGILWHKASRCYEQLRVEDNMNESWPWPYGFKFYKKRSALMTWRIPDRELRALYAMNSSGMWLRRMSPSHELNTLNVMNNSRLWVTWATLGHELPTLDVMKNSGYWKIWANRDPVISSLCMLWTTQCCRWYEQFLVMGHSFKFYEQHRAMDDMNDSR